MRIILIISILFIISLNLHAQTRRIHGHIINEDLESIPMVTVYNSDTIEIAKANIYGQFTINLPIEAKELSFAFVGMEWTTIKLKDGCDTIDIVMMNEWIYDFISLKSADRKRLKRFKKLSELHQIAYDKNIFSTPFPCYDRVFERYKPKKQNRKNKKTSS